MTVGIAAVAGWDPQASGQGVGTEAIVLVSDDEVIVNSEKLSSAVPKRRGILQRTGPDRCGWWCVFSSSDTDQVDSFLAHLRADSRTDAYEASATPPLPGDVTELLRAAASSYKQSGGRLASEFVVGGFDRDSRPLLFRMTANGKIYGDERLAGRAATGSGEEYARTRLAWHRARSSDPLHQILYKAYDAKRHAERADGVGSGTHIAVMFRDREDPQRIPDTIIAVMRDAFDALEAPVFGARPTEPDGWRERLADLTADFRREAIGR